MKAKALSIIIPVYNEEDYLFDCLQAIANQTVMPHEVIVVDNNSTDNTVEMAKRFKFVTLIKERRQGLYYARQTGMSHASGDILCRIDADTIVDNDWSMNILDIFSDQSVALATGPVGFGDFVLSNFGREVGYYLSFIGIKLGYDFIYGCNMVIRKEAWHQIEHVLCNKPDIFEDIDIAIHMKQLGVRPVYIKKIKVMVSARRLLDKPKQFIAYIGGHSRTLKYHNISFVGAKYAEAVFISAYVLIRPFYISYDKSSRRFKFSNLLKSTVPRPDPMNVD